MALERDTVGQRWAGLGRCEHQDDTGLVWHFCLRPRLRRARVYSLVVMPRAMARCAQHAGTRFAVEDDAALMLFMIYSFSGVRCYTYAVV